MKKIIRPKFDNDTVLDILRREKIFLCADCGGIGTCGKCKVRFTDQDECPEPSEEDWKLIPKTELARGYRLACTASFAEGSSAFTGSGIEIEIPARSMINEGDPGDVEISTVEPLSHSEIIAVDYGTTMICGALVDLNRGVTAEASVINHQKAYGADVLSRIRAANDGYGEELRHVSEEDLADLAVKLHRDPDKVRYIISGNTVMGHLISGFSCKGLGEFPYEPVDISLRRDENLTFLPGISGFVGADILSGICACSLDGQEAPWLYIDIGTNGEMAVGAGGKIIAASAPAGPAFEGGCLSSGMPAVPGAVCSAVITGERAVVSTIGGVKASGICGSGAVDIIAELLKNRIIDSSGTLAESFADDGFPVTGGIAFTQKDIREIQKAKAAIRAGMETLIEESGIKTTDIRKLIIAGSFGAGLNIENACAIGLIPEELLQIYATAGNASLSGAVLYALDTGFSARLAEAKSRIETVDLSEVKSFSARYIADMSF